MSRQVVPRVLLLVVFLFIFSKTNSHPSDDCLKFDIDQLEDYLSKLDFGNVPTINMMIGGFKCPVTALPFGALKSDWARLKLLREAQPNESILSKKLDRLFRILVVAYFQMEECFDVTESRGSSSPNASTSIRETTNSVEGMRELENLITDSGEANGIPASSSTVLNKGESTIKTEGITPAGSNVTGEGKKENSDALLESVSSLSHTTMKITIFSSTSTEKIKETVTSRNHLDNSTLEGKTLITNGIVATTTKEMVPVEKKSQKSRGDFPSNSVNHEGEKNQNITTDFNSKKYENSGYYSNKTINNTVVSNGSFNQTQTNTSQVPEEAPTSSLNFVKIKKPVNYKIIPLDNGFWKYFISEKTSTFRPTPKVEKAERYNKVKTKKRGSLNTDIEKMFRWFYNVAHEDEKYISNDLLGINIECKRNRHVDGE